MPPSHPLLQLAPRADDGTVNVVIETPAGSVHKLSFDDERGVFVLKKTLPVGMTFPHDFGFVPRTKAGDGDPLDVLVLHDGPTPPGVVVEARLVGVIEAEQRTGDGSVQRNDRLIAVGIRSRTFGRVRRLDQLPRELIDDLERFFVTYSTALGKDFRALGRGGPERADARLDEAIGRHREAPALGAGVRRRR
jgi:inorganic pyrophosphatase